VFERPILSRIADHAQKGNSSTFMIADASSRDPLGVAFAAALLVDLAP
jgi:hypothetical protein